MSNVATESTNVKKSTTCMEVGGQLMGSWWAVGGQLMGCDWAVSNQQLDDEGRQFVGERVNPETLKP